MSDWKQDLEINPDALDVEWVKQAALFGRYCEKQADVRDKADRLKEKIEVLNAGLGLKIRANPASFGLEKITEASVQAVILLDKEYQELIEQQAKARYELELMQSAVRSLDQKKSALENLVRLQGQNYFAGPSVPREIGKEWVKEVERNGARGKVKAAMGTSRQINRV